mgnify:CR=1 FL=1
MQYVSAIPGIIILLIAIGHVTGLYFAQWRPGWTKPFISEQSSECFDLSLDGRKQRLGWVLALFSLSLIGFTAELVQLVLFKLGVVAVILSISWVGIPLI